MKPAIYIHFVLCFLLSLSGCSSTASAPAPSSSAIMLSADQVTITWDGWTDSSLSGHKAFVLHLENDGDQDVTVYPVSSCCTANGLNIFVSSETPAEIAPDSSALSVLEFAWDGDEITELVLRLQVVTDDDFAGSEKYDVRLTF